MSLCQMLVSEVFPSTLSSLIQEADDHRAALQMIDGPFLPEVQTEQYYAVDYINRYYVGRVLSIDGSFCLMKFLHCGSKIYSWPKHDDTDTVHKSCIFMGLLPCLAQVLSLFLSKEN